MTLDSSFKHHTGNMRLLLIAVTCLAASSALPREKRDVLHAIHSHANGNHRYENAAKDSRAVGLSSYDVPEVPQDTYGPPGYQPGAPLGTKEYLSPAVHVTKYSTPVSSYGIPDTVHVPETDGSYVGLEKSISPTSVPVKTIETASVAPLSTSYGTAVEPVIRSVSDRHVKSTDTTVHTEVSDTQELPRAVVKVDKQVPPARVATPQLTAAVNTVPAVIGSHSGFDSTLLAESLPSVESSYSGVFNVPSYTGSSYLPPSFYSAGQETIPSAFNSFDSFSSGFGNVDASYSLPSTHHGFNLDFNVPLPLSVQYAKSFPTSYSLPQTVKQPVTTFQAPHSLTHVVQRTHPVKDLPLPPCSPTAGSHQSLSLASSLTPVQSSLNTLTLTQSADALPISYLKSVNTVTPLGHSVHTAQPLSSLKTVEHLPQVEPTVHPVLPVSTVKTVETLSLGEHSVLPVHPVPSVKTLEHLPRVEPTVHSVLPVSTPKTVETLSTVEHSVLPVHSVSSVKTVEHLPKVQHTVHTAQPLTAVRTVATLPSVEQSVFPVHSVPSVKTVEHLPEVQHTVHTAQPLTAVRTVATLPSVEHSVFPVHPVSSVKTVEHLPEVQHTVHAAQPLTAVRTVATLPSVEHSVFPVHSVSSVKTVEHLSEVGPTVHPVLSVSTVRTVETLPSVEQSVLSVHSVPSVKTVVHLPEVEPTVHPVLPVSPVKTLTSVKSESSVHPAESASHTFGVQHGVVRTNTVSVYHNQPQKGIISDFFGGLADNLSLPTLPSLPSFPPLSFPSLSGLLTSPVSSSSTPAPVQSDVNEGSITVENPLLPNLNTAKSISVANNYVQPTDANGGYIY